MLSSDDDTSNETASSSFAFSQLLSTTAETSFVRHSQKGPRTGSSSLVVTSAEPLRFSFRDVESVHDPVDCGSVPLIKNAWRIAPLSDYSFAFVTSPDSIHIMSVDCLPPLPPPDDDRSSDDEEDASLSSSVVSRLPGSGVGIAISRHSRLVDSPGVSQSDCRAICGLFSSTEGLESSTSGERLPLVALSRDRGIELWNTETGKVLWNQGHQQEVGGRTTTAPLDSWRSILHAFDSWICGVRVLRTGFSDDSPELVRCYDVERGDAVMEISSRSIDCYTMLEQDISRRLLISCSREFVRFWDARRMDQNKRCVGCIRDTDCDFFSCRVVDDELALYVASRDGEISKYDVRMLTKATRSDPSRYRRFKGGSTRPVFGFYPHTREDLWEFRGFDRVQSDAFLSWAGAGDSLVCWRRDGKILSRSENDVLSCAVLGSWRFRFGGGLTVVEESFERSETSSRIERFVELFQQSLEDSKDEDDDPPHQFLSIFDLALDVGPIVLPCCSWMLPEEVLRKLLNLGEEEEEGEEEGTAGSLIIRKVVSLPVALDLFAVDQCSFVRVLFGLNPLPYQEDELLDLYVVLVALGLLRRAFLVCHQSIAGIRSLERIARILHRVASVESDEIGVLGHVFRVCWRILLENRQEVLENSKIVSLLDSVDLSDALIHQSKTPVKARVRDGSTTLFSRLKGDPPESFFQVGESMFRKLHSSRFRSDINLLSRDGRQERSHLGILVLRTNFFELLVRFRGEEAHDIANRREVVLDVLDGEALTSLLEYVAWGTLSCPSFASLLLLLEFSRMFDEKRLGRLVWKRIANETRRIFDEGGLSQDLLEELRLRDVTVPNDVAHLWNLSGAEPVCLCPCGRVGTLRCTACRSAFYCSAKCQKQAWKSHRRACRRIRSKNARKEE